MLQRFWRSGLVLVGALLPVNLVHSAPTSYLDRIGRCVQTLADASYFSRGVKDGELPGWSTPTPAAKGTAVPPRTTVEDLVEKADVIIISTDTAASLSWAAGAGLKWAGATGVGGTITAGASGTMAVTGPLGIAFLGGSTGAYVIDYMSKDWAEFNEKCLRDEEERLARLGLMCDITPSETARRVAPTARAIANEYNNPELVPAYMTAAAEQVAKEIAECKEKMKDSLKNGACSDWGLKSEWQRMRCESIKNIMCSDDPRHALRQQRLARELIDTFGSMPSINCSTTVQPTPTPIGRSHYFP
jgi:hypothetical protein